MRKYQYSLYGVNGEFLGVTTKRTEAQAHVAKLPDIYYFHRYDYDPNDRDWELARERGLVCNDYHNKESKT